MRFNNYTALMVLAELVKRYVEQCPFYSFDEKRWRILGIDFTKEAARSFYYSSYNS